MSRHKLIIVLLGFFLCLIPFSLAVKAMQSDGTEIAVDGIVYDSQGEEKTQFKTEVRGMGMLEMTPQAGESYYAVCTNSKGKSKRFELPAAKETGYALSTSWFKDRLIVNVHQPETQKTNDTLCLIVHTRGVVQDFRILENVSKPVVLQKDFFPSGVIHLLLLNKDMTPVSERLTFVSNDDQAKVESASDKESFSTRSPVEYTVHITNETDIPLMGNFSVSVTDDHVLSADTTANILTSLLLSSDLRGNIVDPAYYFRKDYQSAYALDLLMLTQGWRRYDAERIVRNDLMYPDSLLEKEYLISGTVRNTSLRKPPVKDVVVSIISMQVNFTELTFTDSNGRFYLPDGNLPDNTAFMIQAKPQQARQILELTIDKPFYPERTVPVIAFRAPEQEAFAKYVDKAEQQYMDEHGTRIVQMEEVVVTAKAPAKGKDYSIFYKVKDARYVLTEEELEKLSAVSLKSMLNRIPGVFINFDNTVIYGQKPVIFVVDDRLEDNIYIFEQLLPSDIAQVDFLSVSTSAIFSPRGEYVISITTKRGKLSSKETSVIKPIIPLGFQKPAEFYTPKYETPAANPKPDLRTTIHWQPNITTDENGKATFSFYTADTPAMYTVTIEGVTADGRIVYKRDKIVVK